MRQKWTLDAMGLGGEISIAVHGPEVSKLRDQLQELVELHLPGEDQIRKKYSPLTQSVGEIPQAFKAMKVFLSYTWNPKKIGERILIWVITSLMVVDL